MKRLVPIALVLCTTPTFGQTTVSGKVVEFGSAEPLPFANIVVKGTKVGSMTNTDGFFSILNVPAQFDLLIISYVGYETRSFKINPSSRSLQTYALKPLTGQLDEVTVNSESYKILDASSGISSVTLSTKQLSNLPNLGETDIFRSLQLLPGVSGTNENSSGLFIRGSTSDQNLVLLDGMTVYKVDHFFGFFSTFNANAVKDVQLFKGAFPARYGGRTSGVIDLTGKTGSFEKPSAGFDVNLLSINGYFETPITKNVSFFIAGRRSYTDIIESGLFTKIRDNVTGTDALQNLVNANAAAVEPEFYFYDWNGKLSYKPSERDLITFSIYSGRDFLDESRDIERSITTPLNPETRLFHVDIVEKTDWGNNGASAKWTRQWSDRLYTSMLVTASEYFSNYTRDAFVQSSIPSQDSVIYTVDQNQLEDNNVRDYATRLDFEWKTSDRHIIETGISFTRTDISYSNMREDTLLLGREQEAVYGSIYLSNSWEVSRALTLKSGLRLTHYEHSDEPLLERRLQAGYKVSDAIKLKFAYGRHYQYVSQILNENISQGARDFWLLADNDLINIGKADHYILGASYETGSWLFDVEGYYKKLSGLSEFSLRFRRDETITPEELFFSGSGIAKGVEFLVQKKKGNYTGWVTYTLGSVRYEYEAFNEGAQFPALHDQLHEFKMVHSYETGRWNLSATFTFGSGNPYTEPEGQYSVTLLDGRKLSYIAVGTKNGKRLPEYHRLDLSAKYTFAIGGKTSHLGLSIFNLYNRHNVWYKQYDFNQEPVLVTNVEYLGITPNFSFGMRF